MIFKNDNILVVNLGGIGDILLSLPALKALKAETSAKVSILVVKRVADFVKGLDCIDEVYELDNNPKSFFKDIVMLLALRWQHYDLSINMRTIVSKSSARKIQTLFKIINAKCTAGRNTDGMGSFFDISIEETLHQDKAEMEFDIDLARKIGLKVENTDVKLKIPEKDSDYIESFLAQYDVGDKMIIGIHPGGKCSHRWDITRFAELMNFIAEQKDVVFFVTGSLEERVLAEQLQKLSATTIVRCCGELSISQTAALIDRCSMYICNDTGPMHIAASLKKPMLAFFGPGYLQRYDPRYANDKAVVLVESQQCAPCDLEFCEDMKCLNEISVKQAKEEFLECLKKLYTRK